LDSSDLGHSGMLTATANITKPKLSTPYKETVSRIVYYSTISYSSFSISCIAFI